MKSQSERIIALLGPTNTGKTYVAIDTWNFNRNLDERNKKLAEQTPLPKND